MQELTQITAHTIMVFDDHRTSVTLYPTPVLRETIGLYIKNPELQVYATLKMENAQE